MPETPLIASFGRRRGRKLRAGKQRLWDEALPTLGVRDWGVGSGEDANPKPFSLPDPLWLEIGFGAGEHLAAQAEAQREVSFIGCEPYVNGIGHLLAKIEEKTLTNIRIYTGDVRELLPALPEASVERVFILFPDPWPKARHHKRRLIQQPFLSMLACIMKPGAELMLATDHADYLTWMLEQMVTCPHFQWTAKGPEDWQNPPHGWVETRYQQKAKAEGREATWLIFKKNYL